MSKKQKQAQQQNETEVAQPKIESAVVKEDNRPEQKSKKLDKKDKKKDKKKKEKTGGIGKKTKETVSELKKVTWPGFGEVVKKTGIVIAFVILFGLFLFGVNYLLGWLVSLLMG